VLAPDESDGYPVDLSGGARLLVAEADGDDAVVILRHRAHQRRRSNGEHDDDAPAR
jgi:hypothetical protein